MFSISTYTDRVVVVAAQTPPQIELFEFLFSDFEQKLKNWLNKNQRVSEKCILFWFTGYNADFVSVIM